MAYQNATKQWTPAAVIELREKYMAISRNEHKAPQLRLATTALSESTGRAFSQFMSRVANDKPMSERQWAFFGDILESIFAYIERMTDAAPSGATSLFPLATILLDFLNKSPGKVIFASAEAGHHIQFKYTGEAYTKYPHQYHITLPNAGLDIRYAGRLTETGALVLRRNLDDKLRERLLAGIAEINKDPVGAARLYAQATSQCSFCQRELTTPASVHYGYGPICAYKYELPYDDSINDTATTINTTLLSAAYTTATGEEDV